MEVSGLACCCCCGEVHGDKETKLEIVRGYKGLVV